MKENNIQFILNNDNIFSIQAFIPIGSIHEKKGQYGISHFLEHIKFNKSKNYDKTNFIQKISNTSVSNAYTTKDHTSYYLKANDNDYNNLINLMYELVFNTEFKNNDIEIEKKIIEEEKLLVSPNNNILDNLQDDIKITTKLNPYNRNVIGNLKDIRNINNEKLKKFNELYFNDYLIIISCSSDLENKVKKICMKKFPDSLNKKLPKLKNIDSFKYSLTIRNISDKQNNLIMVFKSFNELDNNKYYINFILNFLLSNKNTILIRKLREEKGYIYNLSARNESYKDYANLTMVISSKKTNNIYDILKILFEEFNKLKNEKIKDNILKKYKKNYLSKLNYQLKDNGYLTNTIANYIFYDKNFTIDKYKKLINNLNSNKLKEIFQLLFNYNTMTIASYGNYNNINYTKKRFVNIIKNNRKI